MRVDYFKLGVLVYLINREVIPGTQICLALLPLFYGMGESTTAGSQIKCLL